jgi:hypothetical protein
MSHVPPHRAYDLRTNRTRLRELDQEAIKIRPLPTIRLPNGPPDAGTGSEAGRVVRHVNRDLSKVSMFGYDGLEWRDDPLGTPRNEPKHRIFEFCCVREVNRT